MASLLLARVALPGTGPAWGVLAEDRIEIVATDAGTNGGFFASLLQLPRPARALAERRRGAVTLKAAEVMAAPVTAAAPHLLPPLDLQEVWAAGVTYERSRVARMEETAGAEDFYDKVYTAERPELFFKGAASRVSGHNGPIRIRRDASWNVPEPEIAVLITAHGEIAGYTAGNDVSSRDIEGENPLYLPQAKVYRESCALGPVVWLTDEDAAPVFDIAITIQRRGAAAYEGKIATSQMRRSFADLAEWLVRDNVFPAGAYLLTGTGLVPEAGFSLAPDDRVSITVPRIGTLSNRVVQAGGSGGA
ncbi:MAG TPA: fumarylacetoacetate hydrolase family protein [Methylomirabilota bacterium]|nr:fumarylacetoacetate hydrolase family protein [Methylomirabilota bacterium]